MGAVVSIGLDLGQQRDPTAIAVVERDDRHRPAPPATAAVGGLLFQEERRTTEEHFAVRHLERLPLGTSYPNVARRVVAVCGGVQARTGEPPALYVDATGLGQPVVDVLREAGVPAVLVPTYFTHGDRLTWADGTLRLGKAFLVSRLQALLQGGQLHLPQTAEATALAEELLNYELKVDPDGDLKAGAFRTGTHDDLVTALGLAVVYRSPYSWDAF